MDQTGGQAEESVSRSDDQSRLARALKLALSTSLIDLRYVRLGPDESLLEAALDDVREDAITKFSDYLEDREDEVPAVRQGLAWLLDLSPQQFAEVVQKIKVPYPYFRPHELHSFLDLLGTRTWGHNWRVPQGGGQGGDT